MREPAVLCAVPSVEIDVDLADLDEPMVPLTEVNRRIAAARKDAQHARREQMAELAARVAQLEAELAARPPAPSVPEKRTPADWQAELAREVTRSEFERWSETNLKLPIAVWLQRDLQRKP